MSQPDTRGQTGHAGPNDYDVVVGGGVQTIKLGERNHKGNLK